MSSHGEMVLCDYADGVKGHFCIGRLIDRNSIYWEFYNKGEWCSAGEVFDGYFAKWKLKQLKDKVQP